MPVSISCVQSGKCCPALQAIAAERPPVTRPARRVKRSTAGSASAPGLADSGQPGEAAGNRRRRRARPAAPATPRLDWGDQEYRASVLAGLPVLSAGAQVCRVKECQ